MSEPFELPDELGALEQQLSQTRPTSQVLNRDEVLYRAGYEAARSELLPAPDNADNASTPKSVGRIWMITTGAFATLSAALALMLLLPLAESPSQQPPIAQSSAGLLSDVEVKSSEHEQPRSESASQPPVAPVLQSYRNKLPAVWTANQSPFRLGQRADIYDWSKFAVNRSRSSGPTRDTSNRALLNELLNESRAVKRYTPRIEENKQPLQGENS